VAVRRRPARGAPGRHVLRSSRLAAELVREAEVGARDLVADIGAGTGVLTRALADAGAEVIALELEPALATQLRRRFAANRLVTVVEVDALRWEPPNRPFAVVSNLPFANSGAILMNLLRDPRRGLRQADVIVQWEFAAKHSAVWPATLKGTYWRAWYEVSIVRRLARTAFSPAPGVDAAVLRFARHERPLIPAEDCERYWRLLSAAFRDQTLLRRSLRPHISPLQLKRLAPTHGFAPGARPRDLDARQWAALFAALQLVRPTS
jgi:23S rRNA (adenine-N6)-dimethyltransferase